MGEKEEGERERGKETRAGGAKRGGREAEYIYIYMYILNTFIGKYTCFYVHYIHLCRGI